MKSVYPDILKNEVLDLMRHSDLFGVSTFPGLVQNNPVDATYFAPAVKIADALKIPIGIEQTGFNSENFDYPPLGVSLPGSNALQRDFIALMLNEAKQKKFEFIVNFVNVDYEPSPNLIDNAWFTNGFVRQDGTVKPALAVWDNSLKIPYRVPAARRHVTLSVLDATAVEGVANDTATVRFSLNLSSPSDFYIPFTLQGTARAGVDYVSPTLVARIPANAQYVDVVFRPQDDTLREGVESIQIVPTLVPTITYPQANRNPTLYILDNDVPTVTCQVLDASSGEPGQDVAKIRFTRSGPTTSALSIPISVSGTATPAVDYYRFPTTLTIAAGTVSSVLTLTPKDDAVKEPMESVILSVPPNTGFNAPTTKYFLPIFDND